MIPVRIKGSSPEVWSQELDSRLLMNETVKLFKGAISEAPFAYKEHR